MITGWPAARVKPLSSRQRLELGECRPAQLIHGAPVSGHLFPAETGQAGDCPRLLVDTLLADLNESGGFEVGQLYGQISLAQSGDTLQEQEIGAGASREHGQDGEPRGFVHQTIGNG